MARTAAPGRASRPSPFTCLRTAGRSANLPRLRPPIPPPCLSARPAIPTVSSASRPMRRATCRRRRRRRRRTVQILTPTTVSSIIAVSPSPRNSTVSDIDVTFTQPLDLTGSDYSALTLTDNGGPNLITSAVTMTLVSGSTYEIGGLTGLTAAEGDYAFSVSPPC